ncbi:hypothetical protein DFR75_1011133 [Nocardia ignorata]|uniref:Uncharacterized protein n=1 Tax=Nocardia ignorata TaxID=145285 RepID=A0A4R6PUR1_NOCIG|nr:hypothetical protein DFR75_1011133 [Nocardia ignorata]
MRWPAGPSPKFDSWRSSRAARSGPSSSSCSTPIGKLGRSVSGNSTCRSRQLEMSTASCPVGEGLIACGLTGRPQRPEVRSAAERSDIVRADNEEAPIYPKPEWLLSDRGSGWTFGTGLPAGDRSRALVDHRRQGCLTQASQLSRQCQATAVEEGGRLDRSIGGRGPCGHCAPTESPPDSVAGRRRRRTGASGSASGPVGTGPVSPRQPPLTGGRLSRFSSRSHVSPPAEGGE